MPDSDSKPKGFWGAVDTVAGVYIIGTVGYLARHAARIPPVMTAGKWVAGHLKAGWDRADLSIMKGVVVGQLNEIQRSMGVDISLTPDQIRAYAVKAGVPEEHLDAVVEAAQAAAADTAAGAFSFPVPNPGMIA